MENNNAHELTRDIIIAMITSDKPIATSQCDYVSSVCEAYKMIYNAVMGVEKNNDEA